MGQWVTAIEIVSIRIFLWSQRTGHKSQVVALRFLTVVFAADVLDLFLSRSL